MDNKKTTCEVANKYSNIIAQLPNITTKDVLDNAPELIKEIITPLSLFYNNMTVSCLINLAINKISWVATSKRINLAETLTNTIIPNHYCFIISGSGKHKGQTSNFLDKHLLCEFKEDFNKRVNDYYNDWLANIEEKADTKFKGDTAKKQAWIDSQKENINLPTFIISKGTKEGFYENATALQDMSYGSIMFKQPEAGRYINAMGEADRQFFDCFYEGADGIVENKRIKGDKGMPKENIEGIPVNLLLMSSPEVLKTKKTNELLISGLNRRSCITFNGNGKIKKSIIRNRAGRDEIAGSIKKCGHKLYELYKLTNTNTCYTLKEETYDGILQTYKDYIVDLQNSIDSNKELLKQEVQDREIKALKLSCIYAWLNHPNSLYVDDTDFIQAVYTIEYLGKDLEKFLNFTPKKIDEYDKVFEYLKNIMPEKLTATKIRQEYNRFGLTRRDFAKRFEEIMQNILEMAEENGYVLKHLAKRYWLEEQKLVTNDKLKLSYSTDLTSNYKFVDLTVDELKELIKLNCNFVAGELKDGYRKDENYIGNQKTIWLDFDDGITLTEAKEMFKDYWYLIYTSRNHQKVKGKKPACDRFRVILQTEQAIPADKYEVIMDNIIKEYNADSACKNKSRLYYGNADAQIFTNDGAYFDWSSYNVEPKKVQLVESKAEYKGDNVGLTDETIDTDYGDKILKTDDIIDGNRDNALAYSVGVLIEAVNKGNLSHHVALNWFDSIAWNISTPDFKENIKKFRKRLEELKF